MCVDLKRSGLAALQSDPGLGLSILYVEFEFAGLRPTKKFIKMKKPAVRVMKM